MLQALIEDRFKAAFHGETKELPVYFLTVAKNGSKLKGTSCLTPGPNERVPVERRCASMGMGEGMLYSAGTGTQDLAAALSSVLKRKVLDRTGLTGKFEMNLKWKPDTAAPDSGPSIFTAIEEQLGLKLESGKAPLDVLVIDHIERPSQN